MPRGQTTTLELRMKILELAKTHTDPAIAALVGVRPVTVRKWRRRGRTGPAGLATRRGRPSGRSWAAGDPPGPEGGVVAEIRTAHPGWGPQSLQLAWADDPRTAAQPAPSCATLARFLRAKELSRRYRHRSQLPAVPRPVPTTVHETWQMDARGHSQVPALGQVTLINLGDCYSRLRLLSQAVVLGTTRAERHLNVRDYQQALRRAFTEWGLPHTLQVDHESVFADNDTASPYPTPLHLWLLALGVPLTFSRVYRPTDQGAIERQHQIWEAQVLRGQTFPTLAALQAALDARREVLNRRLPHRLLGQAPLLAFPEAGENPRRYCAATEAAQLDLARIDTYLAQARFFRLVSSAHTLSLGGHVYYLGRPWRRGTECEVTYHPEARQWRVCAADRQLEQWLAPKGLEVAALMHPAGSARGPQESGTIS